MEKSETSEKGDGIKGELLRQIQHYLLKAKTPERKGKMNSEKAPYVITSTAYKKLVENKEKLKDEKKRRTNVKDY